MLLWIGFLGASICAHDGRHLRMEAFDRLVPRRFARHVRTLGLAAAAVFCLFLALLGYDYVTGPSAATQSAQLAIPDRASIVSVPIGLLVSALRFAAAAVSAFRGGSYGKPVSEDEELRASVHGADTGGEEPSA
jgi:TRAP-type C4-dicarboxylate transport system permease small subunit